MPNQSKKGVILFIVLGTIIVVMGLAIIVLRIIASQSRLTHHQVSRIQALYAAKAGMVYAQEMLRTNVWYYNSAADNSCPNPVGCTVSDGAFPPSVDSQHVHIIFCPSGIACRFLDPIQCNSPLGLNFCVNSTTEYTYTP